MANEKVIATSVKNREHIAAYDELARIRLETIAVEKMLVYLIDIVEESALVHLAEQFDVMGYKGWLLCTTVQQKRDLIKSAIEFHRYKGTPWAVKESIRRFGYQGVDIQEHIGGDPFPYNGTVLYDGSHNYGGNFHWAYFRVLISVNNIITNITAGQWQTIIKLIEEYKNVRSWLLDLTFTLDLEDSLDPQEDFIIDGIDVTFEDNQPLGLQYNGQWQYNGQNQYDFDILDIVITDANQLFNYTLPFEFN
jgi:P2-related tail formation protein